MGRKSKKGIDEPKKLSLEFPGRLHFRLTKMAEAESRSLAKQIPIILEEAVKRWERKHDLNKMEATIPKEKTGERFIRLNEMTKKEVQQVLRIQKTNNHNKRFGEIAVEQGFISRAILDDYLDAGGIR